MPKPLLNSGAVKRSPVILNDQGEISVAATTFENATFWMS